jgi:hypothetical protein
MRMTMVVLIALAAGAFAQGPPQGRGGRGRMGFDGPPGPGGPLEPGAGMLRAGVTNAPFSADVITETTQTLADGNHIHQTVTSKVYRDSEGRTRREQAVNLNGLAPSASMQQMVFINDPVAGVSYSLNAKDHTGMKYVRNGRGSQRLSQDASGAAPRPRPGGPDGLGMGRHNASDQNLKTEALGRQALEGVQAEGRRTTMTIPAGQAGNELPIHIVVESWYSSDLQTTVLSKHSDPRNGDTVTRLANISRSEPAHTLFEPPTDYKVSESPAGMPRPRKQ